METRQLTLLDLPDKRTGLGPCRVGVGQRPCHQESNFERRRIRHGGGKEELEKPPLAQNALQRVHWTKRVERARTHTWRAVSLVSASLDRVPMRAAVSVGHVSMYSNVDAGDAIGAPRRRSEAVDCEIGAHTYAPSAVLDVRIKGCIFTLGIASHLLLLYMATCILHPAPMAHPPALAACPRSSLSSYGGSAYRPTSQKSVVPCGRSTRGSQS